MRKAHSMKGALRDRASEMIAAVAAEYGVTVEAVLSRQRRRDIGMARATIAAQLEEAGYTHEMIAQLINRTRSGVYCLICDSHPRYMQVGIYAEIFNRTRTD